jgi:hypothetical protein
MRSAAWTKRGDNFVISQTRGKWFKFPAPQWPHRRPFCERDALDHIFFGEVEYNVRAHAFRHLAANRVGLDRDGQARTFQFCSNCCAQADRALISTRASNFCAVASARETRHSALAFCKRLIARSRCSSLGTVRLGRMTISLKL